MTAPPPRQPTRMFEAVPVFAVADVHASLDWYTKVLGFEEAFVWPPKESGETPTYAGVCRHQATIHLSAVDSEHRPTAPSLAMIFMRGVDEYAAAIKESGGELVCEPADQPYRMRDFVVADPDGNRITFGTGIDEDGNPQED